MQLQNDVTMTKAFSTLQRGVSKMEEFATKGVSLSIDASISVYGLSHDINYNEMDDFTNLCTIR